MKAKHLSAVLAVLLVTAGFWVWHTHRSGKATPEAGLGTAGAGAKPGEMQNSPPRFAPPDPNRKFRELTPEQRVQRARQGPIGG